jgi:hypothetical protein
MYVFEEIIQDAPALATDASALLGPEGIDEGVHVQHVSTPWVKLLLQHEEPEELVKLLCHACIDRGYLDALLKLCGDEAQMVVDTMQLVSIRKYPTSY